MHDTPTAPAAIAAAIERNLPGARAHVANPSGDGMHFIGEVYGPMFEGLNRIAQHRLVYAALEELFAEGLHGLKLTTGVESKK
ncbi:MAG TPA: BolA/IbaG family iron-sulfur metabolism protein [Alphaproteobacteria bacterium]|nr:BolA/IbaG family iron-sulfur metabolism protein [Alphaproteobacteria bacterium]